MKLAILIAILAVAWLANRARVSPSLADRTEPEESIRFYRHYPSTAFPLLDDWSETEWATLYERAR